MIIRETISGETYGNTPVQPLPYVNDDALFASAKSEALSPFYYGCLI
jgi:hypothetical protein